MRLGSTALFMLVGFSIAGCGTSDGRLPVSGTITLKGQPVTEGTINFQSEDGATMSGGLIKDGKYEVPAVKGLPPGKYIVRISAAKPGSAVDEPVPGESGPPAEELVPPEFNSNSTLTFEAKEGTENQFNFDVP